MKNEVLANQGRFTPTEISKTRKSVSQLSQIKREYDSMLGSYGDPKKISSDAEYSSLPPGARYIAPDGSTRQKR